MKWNTLFSKCLILVLIFSLFFIFESAHSAPLKWSYSGKTGPEYWGSLDPAYVKCSKGFEQSPININTANLVEATDLDPLKFRYTTTPFKVLNTGHTIEVIPRNQENSLWIDNERYILKQLHFHHQSEHEINNKEFPIEIHLVHQHSNGKLAVVGIFVKEGLQNNVLKNVFEHLPRTISSEEIVEKPINLTALLPKDKSFFTYDGSLTTPPCTEDVTWFILKEPIEMEQRQIRSFSELYPSNDRPLQPLNNRVVFKRIH